MNLRSLLALILAFVTGVVRAENVGFQQLQITNGSDRSLSIGIWYPTQAASEPASLPQFSTQIVAVNGPIDGRKLPLVLISHGQAGYYGVHYDTALALAHAGFVVAAVSHTGDTYDDQSRLLRMSGRPAHLRRLLDYMLSEWPDHARIDPRRIGAFGFSLGGFTVLSTIGGIPDLSKVAAFAATHPDFDDSLALKRLAPATIDVPPASNWFRDTRIKAAVVAEPGIGYTFGREGLRNVTVPIQLWRDEFDHHQPNPYYSEAVREALPRPPEFHVVANADHYDFLPPCPERLAQLAPQICSSRPGFDRAKFHVEFNAEVVRFFRSTLR